MRRIWHSTRFRVALVASLTSAVALGTLSVWFVVQLQGRLEQAAQEVAGERTRTIVQMLRNGTSATDLDRLTAGLLYEVTDRQGRVLASCPVLRDASLKPPGQVDVVTVQPYEIEMQAENTVHCADMFGRSVADDGTLTLYVETQASDDNRYLVRGAAAVDPAGAGAVTSVRTVLLAVVPLVSLLIGAIAWLAVRRSLRPVEAIRSEVAEISAHELGRRVPVPAGEDEIGRLAETMNTMLTRLDTAVTRQSQFTADASHELRTPLTSIRTQLEVLLTHPDHIEWRPACENAVLDVTRMQDLVADLLLLSKLEKAASGEFVPVPLAGVVNACLAGREPRDGVVITSDIAGDPVVRGNRARLTRMVRNLVDNAERHAGGYVHIAVSTTDTECVVTVADDGPGIPAEDRQLVFDRFVRLDDGRDRDDGGSGLGLAIVAEIARAHGGSVTVGDGARFVVRLPRAES
ncbi:HAMP domain-containing histidine kinase [Amycolatopsis sp. NBC_00345]|uniref:sensor histidine kinase n=1 Tax=Amycolatopsis sp. NBC_00345 TaxID=2975955 RepID=UPI002E25B428